MNLYAVIQVNNDFPVIWDFAFGGINIHYFKELRWRPCALSPTANDFAIANKVDFRLNGKVHIAKRKLNVKLPHQNLSCGLPNYF